MKYRNSSNTPLILTKEEPYDRLREFCKLGNYRYNIFWDRYSNGVLITCEVFYFLGRQKKTIHRESQFVLCDNKDVKYFKNIICESFLHNLGLVTETTYNSASTDDEDDEVNLQMKSTLTRVLGRTAQTLSETLKNGAQYTEKTKEEESLLNGINEVFGIVSEGINLNLNI